MQTVPLTAVPSQSVTAVLNGQSVSLAVYQLGTATTASLYCDLQSNGTPIVNCRQCRAFSGSSTEAAPFLLLDAAYWGFQGDFLFLDTQGDEDPQFSGLGSRWQLVYYTPDDLAALS
jgi:hypothetical protein